MTSTFVRCGMAFLLIAILSGPTYAQEKPKGVFAHLQKETVTLYDVGMKSLRRLALDAAATITATPDMEAASSVSFKPTVGNIEIVVSVKT